jgi:hypothetical protein
MTRLYDPNKGSADVLPNPGQGDDLAAFNANGVAEVSDVSLFQKDLNLREVGVPGLYYAAAVQGDATTTITVPAGKYWRLIGVNVLLITDASVGNRTVKIVTQDSADTEIEALTHANVAASQTIGLHALYGSEAYTVGNLGVAAQGTLTMDTNPTAADTMVLEGVTFTFVAALTGAANEILIGANVAATKVTLQNAVGTSPSGSSADHSVSDAVRASINMEGTDFSGNDMVFTALVEGTDGNGHTTTETFTAGTNVFDAATLGTTTAGVNDALLKSAEDFPEDFGSLLLPGEDIVITEPGVSDTGDDLYIFVNYIEYDADPQLAAGIGYNS